MQNVLELNLAAAKSGKMFTTIELDDGYTRWMCENVPN